MAYDIVALPDPDSEEMGFLVDGWLVSLREAGMSPRQLEHSARALARAVEADQAHRVVLQFEAWVAQRNR